jgi:uncharacterized protein (TIGR00255 family)
MVYSMTGYGRGELEFDGRKVTVEINSLNNRFCEILIRLPKNFSHFEPALKETVAEQVKRGKVLVAILIEENPELMALRLELNRDNANMYLRVFESLKKDLKLPGEIELKDFVGLPDLIKPVEEEIEEDELRALIIECLKSALEDFIKMRGIEGKRLLDDMVKHVDKIEASLLEAEKSAEENIRLYHTKLEQRLKELVGDISISEDIIATEAALVADRSDITEECVRIKSHIAMFRTAYDSGEPVGKKMNFILQELYREANTIGSKSISPEISKQVILMKEEIEKVREQVQNIE